MNGPLVKDGFCTQKESLIFESKRCKDTLPKSFWETYSSFANTIGGTIVLGFTETDDGRLKLTGVENPEKIVKDLWDLLHDKTKVSSNILTEKDVRILSHESLDYICVRIPRADRHRRPIYVNNSLEDGTYRRNNEGDYHCTIPEILEMGRDASEDSIDQRVIEESSIKDINLDTLQRFRNHMRSYSPNHPWLGESDEEYLRLLGAAENVKDSLKLTQAGLLMFGYDHRIERIFPQYRLDYREYEDDDEWSDRFCTDTGLWSGNIFDFYIEVSNRLFRWNKHPFKLDKDVRVDDNEIIKAQREMILNALVHSDYLGKCGVTIKLSSKELQAENPGCFRISPEKAMKGGYSDARNPRIMKMFMLCGFVERSGSGLYRIIHACKKEGLSDPIISEELDPSRVVISMDLSVPDLPIKESIPYMMSKDPKITVDQLAQKSGMSKSSIMRMINELRSEGKIERIGGPRGTWKVMGP